MRIPRRLREKWSSRFPPVFVLEEGAGCLFTFPPQGPPPPPTKEHRQSAFAPTYRSSPVYRDLRYSQELPGTAAEITSVNLRLQCRPFASMLADGLFAKRRTGFGIYPQGGFRRPGLGMSLKFHTSPPRSFHLNWTVAQGDLALTRTPTVNRHLRVAEVPLGQNVCV